MSELPGQDTPPTNGCNQSDALIEQEGHEPIDRDDEGNQPADPDVKLRTNTTNVTNEPEVVGIDALPPRVNAPGKDVDEHETRPQEGVLAYIQDDHPTTVHLVPKLLPDASEPEIYWSGINEPKDNNNTPEVTDSDPIERLQESNDASTFDLPMSAGRHVMNVVNSSTTEQEPSIITTEESLASEPTESSLSASNETENTTPTLITTMAGSGSTTEKVDGTISNPQELAPNATSNGILVSSDTEGTVERHINDTPNAIPSVDALDINEEHNVDEEKAEALPQSLNAGPIAHVEATEPSLPDQLAVDDFSGAQDETEDEINVVSHSATDNLLSGSPRDPTSSSPQIERGVQQAEAMNDNKDDSGVGTVTESCRPAVVETEAVHGFVPTEGKETLKLDSAKDNSDSTASEPQDATMGITRNDQDVNEQSLDNDGDAIRVEVVKTTEEMNEEHYAVSSITQDGTDMVGDNHQKVDDSIGNQLESAPDTTSNGILLSSGTEGTVESDINDTPNAIPSTDAPDANEEHNVDEEKAEALPRSLDAGNVAHVDATESGLTDQAVVADTSGAKDEAKDEIDVVVSHSAVDGLLSGSSGDPTSPSPHIEHETSHVQQAEATNDNTDDSRVGTVTESGRPAVVETETVHGFAPTEGKEALMLDSTKDNSDSTALEPQDTTMGIAEDVNEQSLDNDEDAIGVEVVKTTEELNEEHYTVSSITQDGTDMVGDNRLKVDGSIGNQQEPVPDTTSNGILLSPGTEGTVESDINDTPNAIPSTDALDVNEEHTVDEEKAEALPQSLNAGPIAHVEATESGLPDQLVVTDVSGTQDETEDEINVVSHNATNYLLSGSPQDPTSSSPQIECETSQVQQAEAMNDNKDDSGVGTVTESCCPAVVETEAVHGFVPTGGKEVLNLDSTKDNGDSTASASQDTTLRIADEAQDANEQSLDNDDAIGVEVMKTTEEMNEEHDTVSSTTQDGMDMVGDNRQKVDGSISNQQESAPDTTSNRILLSSDTEGTVESDINDTPNAIPSTNALDVNEEHNVDEEKAETLPQSLNAGPTAHVEATESGVPDQLVVTDVSGTQDETEDEINVVSHSATDYLLSGSSRDPTSSSPQIERETSQVQQTEAMNDNKDDSGVGTVTESCRPAVVETEAVHGFVPTGGKEALNLDSTKDNGDSTASASQDATLRIANEAQDTNEQSLDNDEDAIGVEVMKTTEEMNEEHDTVSSTTQDGMDMVGDNRQKVDGSISNQQESASDTTSNGILLSSDTEGTVEIHINDTPNAIPNADALNVNEDEDEDKVEALPQPLDAGPVAHVDAMEPGITDQPVVADTLGAKDEAKDEIDVVSHSAADDLLSGSPGDPTSSSPQIEHEVQQAEATNDNTDDSGFGIVIESYIPVVVETQTVHGFVSTETKEPLMLDVRTGSPSDNDEDAIGVDVVKITEEMNEEHCTVSSTTQHGTDLVGDNCQKVDGSIGNQQESTPDTTSNGILFSSDTQGTVETHTKDTPNAIPSADVKEDLDEDEVEALPQPLDAGNVAHVNATEPGLTDQAVVADTSGAKVEAKDEIDVVSHNAVDDLLSGSPGDITSSSPEIEHETSHVRQAEATNDNTGDSGVGTVTESCRPAVVETETVHGLAPTEGKKVLMLDSAKDNSDSTASKPQDTTLGIADEAQDTNEQSLDNDEDAIGVEVMKTTEEMNEEHYTVSSTTQDGTDMVGDNRQKVDGSIGNQHEPTPDTTSNGILLSSGTEGTVERQVNDRPNSMSTADAPRVKEHTITHVDVTEEYVEPLPATDVSLPVPAVAHESGEDEPVAPEKSASGTIAIDDGPNIVELNRVSPIDSIVSERQDNVLDASGAVQNIYQRDEELSEVSQRAPSSPPDIPQHDDVGGEDQFPLQSNTDASSIDKGSSVGRVFVDQSDPASETVIEDSEMSAREEEVTPKIEEDKTWSFDADANRSDIPEVPTTPRSELSVFTPTFDSRSEISAASNEPVPPLTPRTDPIGDELDSPDLAPTDELGLSMTSEAIGQCAISESDKPSSRPAAICGVSTVTPTSHELKSHDPELESNQKPMLINIESDLGMRQTNEDGDTNESETALETPVVKAETTARGGPFGNPQEELSSIHDEPPIIRDDSTPRKLGKDLPDEEARHDKPNSETPSPSNGIEVVQLWKDIPRQNDEVEYVSALPQAMASPDIGKTQSGEHLPESSQQARFPVQLVPLPSQDTDEDATNYSEYLDIPGGNTRTRLVSTASSRLLPGGWKTDSPRPQ
ncbi:hypothetical protein K439DRAFT_1655818, partial [Ramaria rubella]